MEQIIFFTRRILFSFFWKRNICFSKQLEKRVNYIFFANPETDWHISGYYNPVHKKQIPKISFGGIITANRKIGRGLIVFHPYSSLELLPKKRTSQTKKRLEEVETFRKKIGAKKVAFAGVLPTIFFQRQKLDLLPSFVSGEKGTVYAVVSTFLVVKDYCGLRYPKIVVFGCGRIGSEVLSFLSTHGENIVGFDKGDDLQILSSAELIINLANNGQALLKHEDILRKGVIVVDDTYPAQKIPPAGGRLFKVVSKARGVRFLPRLPSFKAWMIPGCVVEAMVVSATKKDLKTFSDFFGAARNLGLYAPIFEIGNLIWLQKFQQFLKNFMIYFRWF